MNSVGIVTISGDTNYGNRLQNFALQEVLRGIGFDRVETLTGVPTREGRRVKAMRLASTAFERRGDHLRRLISRGGRERAMADSYVCPPERREAIRGFTTKHVSTASVDGLLGGASREALAAYDYLVVGSDQVWNPAFTHANTEWFLSFARPEQRVAYAGSFGIPELPRYLRSRFRRGLNGIRALSVREHQAAQEVEQLTGRKPPVVLDPTMLLEVGRWDDLALQPALLAGRDYIATFMLASGDGVVRQQPSMEAVNRFSRVHGLPVVDLHDPVEDEMRALDPLGFIGALRGASLVVTDSFHAAVFSIMFHVPFLLAPRGAMNSRFETLLEHAGMQGRMLRDVSDVDALVEPNWENVDTRLSELYRRSTTFLRSALGMSG